VGLEMRWQRVADPKLDRAPRIAGWEHRWREADAVERAQAPPGGARRAGLVVVGLAALLAALLATIFPFSPGYSFKDTTASVAASLVVATVAVGVIPLAAAVSRWSVRGGWVLARLAVFAAGLLSAAAATIHLAVLKMHFDEYTLFGLFFVAAGTSQLAWAVWLVLRPSRRLLELGAVGNLLIAALWAADRIWGLPMGPDPWAPDPVGFADSVASAFEFALALCAVLLLVSPAPRTLQARGTGRAAGPVLVVVVVFLTALSLLSVAGVAPSLLAPAA
jgi:hypothetical protein